MNKFPVWVGFGVFGAAMAAAALTVSVITRAPSQPVPAPGVAIEMPNGPLEPIKTGGESIKPSEPSADQGVTYLDVYLRECMWVEFEGDLGFDIQTQEWNHTTKLSIRNTGIARCAKR